jgi:hypothetical protein
MLTGRSEQAVNAAIPRLMEAQILDAHRVDSTGTYSAGAIRALLARPGLLSRSEGG